MKKVGFIGWRGMVGSVLMQRMQAEDDFSGIEPYFFSTSQVGELGPDVGFGRRPLQDAHSLEAFQALDVIVSCQGSAFTQRIYQPLRDAGWQGYWVDAASHLRMADDSIIVLDPVNRAQIDAGLEAGIKTFVGGNCTVSLMLMAMGSLIQQNWVEWINVATYQAISGAGAGAMRELILQLQQLGLSIDKDINLDENILDIERQLKQLISSETFPTEKIGAFLGTNLLPWIDTECDFGQTREEWKGMAETNKILGLSSRIPVDGTCVRVPSLRCHAQALTIKLKKAIPLADIENQLVQAHDFIKLIPNKKESTLAELTPLAASGSLEIHVGRLRKLALGEEYLSLYTVSDQLLWGAAEPLRRVLKILK